MPERLEATYRIVTPMFLGDAECEVPAVIRPPAVKGALRFWWRALNWGRIMDTNCDDSKNLVNLHGEEARVFGSAARMKNGHQKGGQAQFTLKIISKVKKLSCNELDRDAIYGLTKSPWQTYLLGQGLMGYNRDAKANFYLRGALVSGEFTVHLLFRPGSDDQQYKNDVSVLKDTLMLFGLLGGLGSRTRRGLGSVSIVSMRFGSEKKMEDLPVPKDKNEYQNELAGLLSSLPDRKPPFTAFSKQSCIYTAPQPECTPWEALAFLGEQLQCYRGWGYMTGGGNGHIIRQIGRKRIPAERTQQFKQDDHKKLYEIADYDIKSHGRHKPSSHPKSLIFGLPRVYRATRGACANEVRCEPYYTPSGEHEEVSARRASPFFIHIHQFSDNGPALGVQSILPAQFLPENATVHLEQKQRNSGYKSVNNVRFIEDWNVIKEYFKRTAFGDWEKVKLP